MTGRAFAVVGPGRVGTALAKLWHDRGAPLLGFVGASAGSAERAIAFCGGVGRPLGYADLAQAEVVLLAPADSALEQVVRGAVEQRAVRSHSLWLHVSGLFGLDVLAPLEALGAEVGSLHPLCPVPDATAGVRDLPGKLAVVEGTERALPRLRALAEQAGLRALALGSGADRALYHAACALAANGLTALFDLVRALFEDGCGIAAEPARAMPAALMRAALDGIERQGAPAALSGPIQRGDREALGRHLEALARRAPEALPAYRALMARAVDLAVRRGLSEPAAAALRDRLREGGGPAPAPPV